MSISFRIRCAKDQLASGGGEAVEDRRDQGLADGGLVRAFPDPHSDSVLGVEFSRDGRYLASAGADNWVKVWEAASGKLVRAFEGHTHQVFGVSWRSDQKLLASAGADNAIKVWSLETGEQVRTIGGFGKQVTGISAGLPSRLAPDFQNHAGASSVGPVTSPGVPWEHQDAERYCV